MPSSLAKPSLNDTITSGRIIIFGASNGIGRGVAEAVLEAGCEDIAITSSNAARLEPAAKELRQAYPSAKITTLLCDLSDPSTLDQNVDQLFQDFNADSAGKKLQHVVFAAGDPVVLSPLESRTVHHMFQAGMVRFFAAIVVAKTAIKYMERTRQNSITFTGGVISRYSPPGWTLHAAYFAALEGAMRNLAVEYRPLRVNIVSPGPVLTSSWENVPPEMRKTLQEVVLPKCATGAMASAEEVAEAFLYLMRNSNSTGTIVETDGGVSVMSWT